jgi:hypothetical protein
MNYGSKLVEGRALRGRADRAGCSGELGGSGVYEQAAPGPPPSKSFATQRAATEVSEMRRGRAVPKQGTHRSAPHGGFRMHRAGPPH